MTSIECKLVDSSSGRIALVDKDSIRVKVGIGADSELAEDGSGHCYSNIAHLQRVCKEVVAGVEVELVDKLDLLASCSGSVLEVANLRLEVVAKAEVQACSLAFSRCRIDLTCRDILILRLFYTVFISVGESSPTIEMSTLLRTE